MEATVVKLQNDYLLEELLDDHLSLDQLCPYLCVYETIDNLGEGFHRPPHTLQLAFQ